MWPQVFNRIYLMCVFLKIIRSVLLKALDDNNTILLDAMLSRVSHFDFDRA